MASIIKDTPRSRPNGSAALLERRTSPAGKTRAANEATRLLQELLRVAQQQERGELDARVPAENFSGTDREIALAVNEIVGGFAKTRVRVMGCIERLADGDFDAQLEQIAGQKILINDTVDRLRTMLQSCVGEIGRMSEEHGKGDIDVTIPADRFPGSFRKMAQSVNDMV